MKRTLLFLLFALSLSYLGWGQVNISAGNTITQDFTIGTSATATMPTGWKIDKNTTVRSVGTYTGAGTATEQRAGNSMSSSAAAGIYNYAAGDPTSVTERAVGGISSGTNAKSVNTYVQLTNNGVGSITSFSISYTVEKYRKGTNAAGFSIQMYYSTNGTSWTSAGSDFLTSFAGADADNNGYATAPGATSSVSSKTLTVTVTSSSSLYLAWNYSVTSGSTTSNAQALGIDDVSITANGTVTSASSDIIGAANEIDNIAYANYQASSITETSDAVRLFSYTIRDGGGSADADALPTILSSITFNKGTSNSVTNWANTLRQAALFDGTTKVAEVSVTGETIAFTGLSGANVTAADGGSKTLDLYVTFESAVTDNQQFQFQITNGNVTAASSGSSGFTAFTAVNSSVTSDANKIEVTASDIIFDQNVSTVALGAVMSPSPTLRAIDENVNYDLDYATTWLVAVTAGSSTFDGTATTSGSFSAGLTTLSNLKFDAAGTGNTITVTSGSYTDESSLFDVTNPLPEINLKESSTNYLTGSTYAFSNQLSGSSSSAITFTVENLGSAALNLTGTPIVDKSGTNASEFTIDQTSTSSPVGVGSSTTFTITFSPASQGSKTAQISIANDDATGSENPYVMNLTGSGTVSSASDIVNTSGYSYTSNVDYASYQTGTTLTTGNSVGVNGLTIRDGAGSSDGDNLGSTLTALSFTTGGSTAIRTAALFDGSTNVAEVAVNGATTITFTVLNIVASDNGTKDFELRVTYQSSVTDNQQITFTVSSATASATGSGFAAPNAGGAASTATGDINRIEVTASELVFGMNPINVTVNSVMSPSPTVVALDANANFDLDFTGSVTLTSSGTISGTATNPVSAVGGTATFNNLVFSASGTGITIAGSSGSLTATGNSNTFNVTIQPAGTLLFEDNFNYSGLLTANGYSASSGTGTNNLTAGAVGLTYANYASSSFGNALSVANTGQDDYFVFAQQNSPATIYASFLVKISEAKTGDYVFAFAPVSSSTTFRARLFVKVSSNTGYANFGIANINSGTIYGSTDFALNTTHLVVVKYQFTSATSATATVYVNPNLFSEPSSSEISLVDNVGANAPTDITSFTIRQGTAANAPTFVMDGIRIATNWGALLGNPEYDANASISGGNYNTVALDGSATLTASGSVIVNKTLSTEAASTLSIPTNNSITIGTGCQATVSGTLSNNAGTSGIVIKSDATGTGSLISSTEGVEATVERYLINYTTQDDQKFHFISSPVSEQAIRPDFVANTPLAGVDFYKFDEVNNLWINTKDDVGEWNTGFENNFVVGNGYMVAYPTSPVTKNFTGTLNAGTYTTGTNMPALTNTPAKGNGWNLLGNPFPSAIDWDLVSLGDGMDNALYYYDAASQNYLYYINIDGITVGSGSRYIPAMQGFMVHAKSTGTKTVTIDNADRVHQAQTVFYKTAATTPGSLSLKVNAGGYEDVTFVHFNDGATTQFDGNYDAFKLFSYNEAVPQIYTLSSDDKKLAINGLPDLSNTTEILVSFKPGTTGTQVLTADVSQLPANAYLHDLKTGALTDLRQNSAYTFTASTTDAPNRFKLTFGAVGIDTPVASPLSIYTYANRLHILNAGNASVEIINMAGQLSERFRVNETGTFSRQLNLPAGPYVVRVISGNTVRTERIVIN